MQVTEEQRRALYERLREHLDDETATLVMEVTVPANVELATRTDIHELRAELLLRITEVDGHLTLQIADLARRLGEIDSRIGERISGLESDLGERISGLSERIGGLSERIGGLESNLSRTDSRLSERISGLESNLSERISGLDSNLIRTDSRLSERISSLEIKIVEVGEMLSHKLMWRAVPAIAGVAMLLVTLAAWLGR